MNLYLEDTSNPAKGGHRPMQFVLGMLISGRVLHAPMRTTFRHSRASMFLCKPRLAVLKVSAERTEAHSAVYRRTGLRQLSADGDYPGAPARRHRQQPGEVQAGSHAATVRTAVACGLLQPSLWHG